MSWGDLAERKVKNVPVWLKQAAKVCASKDVEEDRRERGFSAWGQAKDAATTGDGVDTA